MEDVSWTEGIREERGGESRGEVELAFPKDPFPMTLRSSKESMVKETFYETR